MHDYLMLGIALASPFVAILVGYFLNSSRVDRLETRMDSGFNAVNARVDSLRTEMSTEMRAIRGDINMLTKMYGEHGERIARLEPK
jgi:hypothetical protein